MFSDNFEHSSVHFWTEKWKIINKTNTFYISWQTVRLLDECYKELKKKTMPSATIKKWIADLLKIFFIIGTKFSLANRQIIN